MQHISANYSFVHWRFISRSFLLILFNAMLSNWANYFLAPFLQVKHYGDMQESALIWWQYFCKLLCSSHLPHSTIMFTQSPAPCKFSTPGLDWLCDSHIFFRDNSHQSALLGTYFGQMKFLGQCLSPGVSHVFSLYSFTDSSQRAYGRLFDAN